jgi:hypothetical protein
MLRKLREFSFKNFWAFLREKLRFKRMMPPESGGPGPRP